MVELNKRRGAMVVLVALMTPLVVIFLAAVLSLSKLYTIRAELHTIADATALTAASVWRELGGLPADTAMAFDSANHVAGKNFVLNVGEVTDSIVPGRWNDTTQVFLPRVTPTNAFRSWVSRPNDSYTLFGMASKNMRASATAWADAPIDDTDCLKPFGVPYKALTIALNKARGLDTSYYQTRDLEADDIQVLRANPTALEVCLKEGSPGSALCTNPGTAYPGNFQIVNVDPPSSGGGAADYLSELQGCTAQFVGIGSRLEVQTGNVAGKTEGGKTTWCSTNYPVFPCIMKTALWQEIDDGSGVATNGADCKGANSGGSGWCVVVRLIGAFVITNASDEGPGQGKAVIEGYFKEAVDGGAVGSTAGSLVKTILVQ